jgi:hypothetical protein
VQLSCPLACTVEARRRTTRGSREAPASVPAAVAKSREARLRAVERRLNAWLTYLRRHGRDEYAALVALLRVVEHQTASP